MNRYRIRQNGFSACQETRSSDKRDYMVCPKPRRVGLFPAVKDPMRWIMNHRSELSDSEVGSEIYDIIFAKGDYGAEHSCTHLSHPFFTGSPPSRVSNPLIQDARFGDENSTRIYPYSIPIPSSESTTSPSSQREEGSIRGNFGNKPAVTIEGFDCQNCSFPTLS